MPAILLLHAALTCAMVGVIWFVQVCHYPLFSLVDAQSFPAFEAAYTRSTLFVIVPLMLGELTTGIWLAVGLPPNSLRLLAWMGLGLLGLIWISTFLIQVPLHQQLAVGFDTQAHARLVQTNWIRTLAWSGRGALAIALVWWGLLSANS